MRTSLPRHPKKRGEWVEAQFLARAIACGLTISRPWGDCARYDFVVELASGALVRIQVKGTSRVHKRGYFCSAASRGPRDACDIPYTPRQIDFFAFYIIPEDVWYIVPIAKMTGNSVLLNPADPNNLYAPFCEAWHLLGRSRLRAARKPRRHPSPPTSAPPIPLPQPRRGGRS